MTEKPAQPVKPVIRLREGQHTASLSDGGLILFEADRGHHGLTEDFLGHVYIAREQISSVLAILQRAAGTEVIHRNVDENVND
ncbi:MAG: hypothetical protein AAGB04_20265, partial [Pseudomonadota bacterium]